MFLFSTRLTRRFLSLFPLLKPRRRIIYSLTRPSYAIFLTTELKAITLTNIQAINLAIILISIVPAKALAQTIKNPQPGRCTSIDLTAPRHQPPPLFSAQNIHNTFISADYSHTHKNGSTILEGDVIIKKNQLRIFSDKAQYSQKKDFLQATGHVHIDTVSLSIDATKATFSLSGTNKQAVFNHTKFIIPAKDATQQTKQHLDLKGTAASITTGDNQVSLLKQATITSCNLSKPDWVISAHDIKINYAEEYASAHDVVIRFKNIPFLYTPYIKFPTSDKRQSGLLFPEFGTSSSRGFEYAQPWYWNIAPNMDATITPHYMGKRGMELGSEYRYLTKSSNGTLQGTYLNNDKVTNNNRYQVHYQQHTQIIPNLQMNVDFQDVSDKNYFNDFSNNLGTTSRTYLDRNVNLSYDTQNWHLQALAQKLKVIDTSTALSTRPYARLPQLTLNGETAINNNGLQFTLNSELVEFAHDDKAKPVGSRITVRPGIQWPLSGAAWFFNPAIKLSHTQYNIRQNNGIKSSISDRNLPISSIDTGLFFERTLSNGLLQTLEPRLYYLNVPYRQQNNIPLFDTSTPNFSLAQLFRDNRFTGGDRIGDANQLTLALSSRLLNPDTGEENIRASIGQIFYFQDRRVSINGTTNTLKQSDIIAELDTQRGALSTNIEVQWDTHNNRFSKENYFLHYQTDNRHIFNIGYRKRLTNNVLDIEQTDTSISIPLSHQLSAYARWNYSLKDKKNIDTIGGFSYDSCCWSIQLLAQQHLKNSTSNNNAYDNSVLIQFVLKGLGNLSGNKARTTLEQSIYGYHDNLQ